MGHASSQFPQGPAARAGRTRWPFHLSRALSCLALGCLALTGLLATGAAPGAARADEPAILSLYAAGSDTPLHRYTLAELKALPAATIETDLPEALQIAGHHVWTGVPLDVILAALGGNAAEIRLDALNDYSITIPAADIATYHPILAYGRDGQDIAVRDKGPMIVIYPFDRYPELEQQTYLNRTIWQVDEIRAE